MPDNDICNMFKSSATHYCVTPCEGLNQKKVLECFWYKD